MWPCFLSSQQTRNWCTETLSYSVHLKGDKKPVAFPADHGMLIIGSHAGLWLLSSCSSLSKWVLLGWSHPHSCLLPLAGCHWEHKKLTQKPSTQYLQEESHLKSSPWKIHKWLLETSGEEWPVPLRCIFWSLKCRWDLHMLLKFN